MNKQHLIKGAFLCLFASVAWGAMFPVAENAFVHLDPFYFSVIRYTVVSLILLALLWIKEGKAALRLEGRGVSLWFFGTMAFTIYNLLVFWGQNQLGSSGVILASVMEALMPMLSVLVLWLYRGQKPQPFTIGCIALALVGCFMVITKGDFRSFLLGGDRLFPVLLILLGVLGWVIYTIGGNQFGSWSVLRYSALSCVLGTATSLTIVLLLTALGVLRVPTLETISSVGLELSFMIIFAGILALLCWNAGIKLLSPINGILFINFVPVTTFLISLAQGHSITVYDAGGTFFIIMALISNNLFQRRRIKLPVSNRAASH
ncbi:DMT family transporter [Brevibacillus ruminantium]|uniref:DMT family transporter n=1 Tax=Brevibacillus ruminantium TaxID=2950604 RepID=A0ABY4WKF0_9BACL|nr:DMT family transporter [Brevibacillus ruminantium]USG67154.1 DMT family transporter [Brevibacillus ruminantium]